MKRMKKGDNVMDERIKRYQRERDAVFHRWHDGMIGRDAARVAIATITVWIEMLAGVGK